MPSNISIRAGSAAQKKNYLCIASMLVFAGAYRTENLLLSFGLIQKKVTKEKFKFGPQLFRAGHSRTSGPNGLYGAAVRLQAAFGRYTAEREAKLNFKREPLV